MSDRLADLRQQVKAALEQAEPMASSWILVYETTELDSDGDVGGAWGSVIHGSQATALGLLDLSAHYVRNDSLED